MSTISTFQLPNSRSKCKLANYNSSVAVIICHPWGLLGGNMHNPVVTRLARYFRRIGITTLQLNFAGSQIGRGWKEVSQVEEAASYLLSGTHCSNTSPNMDTNSQQTHAPSYILLVGYSYGSLITATATASIPKCVGHISIAPPFGVMRWLLLFNSSYHTRQAKKRAHLPRFWIMGEKDNFTSPSTFEKALKEYPHDSTTHILLPGIDHFFTYGLMDVIENINGWLLKVYGELCSGNIMNLSHADLTIFTEDVE